MKRSFRFYFWLGVEYMKASDLIIRPSVVCSTGELWEETKTFVPCTVS